MNSRSPIGVGGIREAGQLRHTFDENSLKASHTALQLFANISEKFSSSHPNWELSFKRSQIHSLQPLRTLSTSSNLKCLIRIIGISLSNTETAIVIYVYLPCGVYGLWKIPSTSSIHISISQNMLEIYNIDLVYVYVCSWSITFFFAFLEFGIQHTIYVNKPLSATNDAKSDIAHREHITSHC